MIEVDGSFQFDDSDLSPEEGSYRMCVALDGTFHNRHVDTIVIDAVDDGNTVYSFSVSGLLRPEYGTEIPPDAKLMFVGEVQQRNEEGEYCWVNGGLCGQDLQDFLMDAEAERIGLSIRRTRRHIGARVKVPGLLDLDLRIGPVHDRIKARIRNVSINARAQKLVGDGMRKRYPARKVLGKCTAMGSIASQGQLDAYQHASAAFLDGLQRLCLDMRHTERGTENIRCFEFPGESMWAAGLHARLPTMAMLMREAPHSTREFWKEQLRQCFLRGKDTSPPGIQSAQEFREASAARRSAFVALLMANAAQMMSYKADEDDENRRGSGQPWRESLLSGAEIFSAAASEGSGDCEDLAILILLLKISFEEMVFDDPILRACQVMSRSYLAFIGLASVHGAEVKNTSTQAMGAHMTLVWMLADVVRTHQHAVSYPIEQLPEVPLPEPGQHTVMISEGTGPFSTGIDHTDAARDRSVILDNVPVLKAPLADPWVDARTGKPCKTEFFSAAMDLYGVYSDPQSGKATFLAYYATYCAPGQSAHTYGAFFEWMMYNMERCKLLPYPRMEPQLLEWVAAAMRCTIPPPPLQLSSDVTRPPSDAPLRRIRAAIPLFIPRGPIQTEEQTYWVTQQALSQPELVDAMVEGASKILSGKVVDMKWDWWPQSDHWGGVWHVTFTVVI